MISVKWATACWKTNDNHSAHEAGLCFNPITKLEPQATSSVFFYDKVGYGLAKCPGQNYYSDTAPPCGEEDLSQFEWL